MIHFFNFLYRHRYDIFFSFLLFILVVFMVIIFPKEETKYIINFMENKTFDIRQNIISKDKKVNQDIVIVTVDDPSYEYLTQKYGDWPIPRNVYAEIIEYIQSQKPKYVALDLLFINSLNRIKGSDDKLIESFKNYANTYTAINFDDFPPEMRTPPLLDDKIKSNVIFESNNIYPLNFLNCRMILPEIIGATSNIGHINTPKSDDGFIRTIPLIVSYNNDYYLYMTLKLAVDYLNKYENQNISDIYVDSNNNLILGNRKIPLTSDAQVILNWYGNNDAENGATFKYISFWEVIKSIEAKQNGETPILKDNLFKDKIVYIGTSVFSLSDIKTVPTSKYMPGVEIHATLLNDIIDNNLILKASNFHNIIHIIILSFLASLIVFKIRSVAVSTITISGLCLLYLYYSVYIMAKYNIWIWVIIPIIVTVIVFICSFIIKYLIKSRDFEYTYKLATTDGLTELYNHRYFQEQLRFKIDRANKLKTSFSLILIDIDFFKKFNDTYGHQAGDAVLKQVAKTLKSNVRSEDFVCRYRGEEMTIKLNNTNHDDAVNIAKKVCSAVASKKYQLTPELEVNVTISLGVATYPFNASNPTELIEYADKCLYKAKENGRNQVGFID